MKNAELKKLLDSNYLKFNAQGFIADDPISLPHLFSKKEDIEIIGFLVAIISWGQRISIINNGKKIIKNEIMVPPKKSRGLILPEIICL